MKEFLLNALCFGFRDDKDLVLKHERNLRIYWNCKMTLFFIQTIFIILEVTILPEIAIFR